MREIVTGAFRFSLVSWILCGFVYPLLANVFAQALFPFQANGSLVTRADGTILGSTLIGQNWGGPQWFHGRPSATIGSNPNDPERSAAQPYNPSNSGGSNLGPTSKELLERLLADRKAIEVEQPSLRGQLLPADMLTASASGLDPEISIANAQLQVPRIAAARSIAAAKVLTLLKQHRIGRSLNIFGEPRVNVLELNLALERAFSCASQVTPQELAKLHCRLQQRHAEHIRRGPATRHRRN
jgi:K+-transporting ATPase ATPase C chain